MKRPLALLGLAASLLTAAAFAASPELRRVAIAELRAIAEPLFERGIAIEPRLDAFYIDMVEDLPPKQRVQRALELAINGYEGAADYVIVHAQEWNGQIARDERLNALIETAINSARIETRMAGFEVHLAEYGLKKSVQQVDQLLDQRKRQPQRYSAWALWNMGLIAARGVDRSRIHDELLLATQEQDPESRRWAVDALARFGGVEVIAPLLEIARSDRSPVVQERAFCGLAQSGTLHIAERYEALPGLLAITERTESNQQTRDWAYQAMREISGLYQVPDDPSDWRDALATAGLLGEH